MFKKILVPVDLAEPELAKPAIETAIAMAALVARLAAHRQCASDDAGHARRICPAGFRRFSSANPRRTA